MSRQKLYPLYENPTYIDLVSFLVRHPRSEIYQIVRHRKTRRATIHKQLQFLINEKLVDRVFNGKKYWAAGKQYNYFLTDKGYDIYDKIIRYKLMINLNLEAKQ